jgi:pimeloyl-ACP methyl ester carboxylesterase
MPSVRVNDIELYFEVHGEGSPLLLIPGLGVDVRFFRGIIDDLATSCRVVAFDPRGAGRSDKPDVPYSIDGMADDAAALLDHLDIERTSVLGCSMGGRTALMLALDQCACRQPRTRGLFRFRAVRQTFHAALVDHGRALADPGSQERRPSTALRLATPACGVGRLRLLRQAR